MISLSNLAPVVAAVRAPVEQLRGAARMLRVSGIVTRVESARLGEHAAGFVSLADEVARLADDIESRSDSVLTAVEGLRGLIERTGQTVLVSERQQNADLLTLLAECRAALDQLHSAQERLCTVSLRAQQGYESIVSDVGQMVMALQFHDSTRQRLEHVDEALSSLCDQLETPGADAGMVAAMAQLQAAQIQEAGSAFIDSVAKVRAELQAIQAASTDLVRAARELSGSNTGTRSAKQGGHFSAVAVTIGEWSESRRSLAMAAEEVSAVVGGSGPLWEKSRRWTRLLRLALNAQVEAVRLAESGAVMEAVAEGIRGVSQIASEHAHRAGEALLEAESGVAGFARELGGADGSAHGKAEEAATRIARLGRRMEESIADAGKLLREVVVQGEDLSLQIADLTASLTADSLMESVASDVCPPGIDRRRDRQEEPDGSGERPPRSSLQPPNCIPCSTSGMCMPP